MTFEYEKGTCAYRKQKTTLFWLPIQKVILDWWHNTRESLLLGWVVATMEI